MEAVYLFFESSGARVPFYDYDERLFRLFASKGGVWDRARCEFVFRRAANSIPPGPSLPGVVFVSVAEDPHEPLGISGFLERPWEQAAEASAAEHSVPVNIPATKSLAPQAAPPPDMFAERWRAKLEEELRSRKYSPMTARSYLYYNRLFCQTLQKSPEDMLAEDTTRFLGNR